ncbi:Serine/threonine-protein kinase cbk1 [Tolypocladium ophioglossoides CBS 100239]|uniref:non-specific serine/threonine protein kinase n=1 Tax=Tolypocladium ophioglossoides (strain CBS 100239) TaxID=1163406 RepID=A0A0L0N845_TOLOC|nr:Serine/threonine-protein kinase cbk1 [Tolypocladium ophioglossoides CBS 100239]
MRPGLLTKRSCPVLEPTPVIAPNVPSPLQAADREDPHDGNVLKIGHGGSSVWSEIRGAIRAIGRTSRTESESSTVLEWSPGENRPATDKGKGVARDGYGDSRPPTPRKGKGITPRDLVKKLGFVSGLDSSTTVVLRGSPLKRRTSLQAFASVRAGHSSEPGSSVSSDRSSKTSAIGNDSTRKTSVDSRFSDSTSMKDSLKRRHSRRHPWSKSSPDGGTLQTIDEGAFQAQPTVLTVERAAAAKIYLETHFNELLNKPSARNLRRQYLESQLYYSPHLTMDQKEAIRLSSYQQETCHVRETRVLRAQSLTSLKGKGSASHTDRYESLKILGRGSFGVVRLVREKSESEHVYPKQVFAMKVIRKSDMLRSGQEGHLRAERDFLVASEGASWIVPLVASFQDPKSLYLVMEYMPGGDFLGLLIRENILHESVARFYIAEMTLAVEEAHRLKFIHRDIKPDNFLISASGHLKISDFGLAFDGHWSHDASYYNCQRYSLLQRLGISIDGDADDQKKCENISTQLPWLQSMKEVLERHDKQDEPSKDDLPRLLGWRNRCGNRATANSVWSIGIILYECLYGHTPFFAEDGRKQTKNNILDHKRLFSFPHRPLVSDKCKDLIYRLIQDKDIRLCSKRYQMKDRGLVDPRRSTDFFGRFVFPDDAEDIKAHRWFKNFPWDRIHTISPPFIPHITSIEDTHYFDESEPIEDFSASSPSTVDVTPDDVRTILHEFRTYVQNIAIDLISAPYDSARLRSADHRIDSVFKLTLNERKVLKHFIRMYGRKERKRPRDILLRDESTKDVAMDVRKETAFMGYAWRRIRPGGYTMPKWTA